MFTTFLFLFLYIFLNFVFVFHIYIFICLSLCLHVTLFINRWQINCCILWLTFFRKGKWPLWCWPLDLPKYICLSVSVVHCLVENMLLFGACLYTCRSVCSISVGLSVCKSVLSLEHTNGYLEPVYTCVFVYSIWQCVCLFVSFLNILMAIWSLSILVFLCILYGSVSVYLSVSWTY